MNAPKFGDWMRGIHASESNPERDGMFVRVVHRSGRMNAGTFYELTDGKGNFWKYPASSTAPINPAAVEGAQGVSGGECHNCAKTAAKLVCLTCVNDAQACAVNDHYRSEQAKVHELLLGGQYQYEGVHDLADHFPLARFTGFYDEGDDSVGIWPTAGWELAADQSGTLLEHILEDRFRVPQNVEINPIPWSTLAEYRRRADFSEGQAAEDWLNAQLTVTTPPPATGSGGEAEHYYIPGEEIGGAELATVCVDWIECDNLEAGDEFTVEGWRKVETVTIRVTDDDFGWEQIEAHPAPASGE